MPMLRAAALTLALLATAASAAPGSIAAAVADTSRPAADTQRDAERKPAEMLAFAGVKPGMTVIDVLPGGGYFTRLFSDVVGPKGKVIAFVPDEMLAAHPQAIDGITAVAAEHKRGNVQVVHHPLMAAAPDAVADVVWTSQNYHDLHNMTGVDVVAFNKAVFRALRPGGVYVILDHSAPAGSGLADTGTLHRIDRAAVMQEVMAAGFVLDGASNVLANPADARSANVFDPSIRGHTDQFVLRFRKPA
jgi:predicted methyltransferase